MALEIIISLLLNVFNQGKKRKKEKLLNASTIFMKQKFVEWYLAAKFCS